MADHAWCHDVARDAAVRAAEDGRDRPLPTLGECIDGMFPTSSQVEPTNKGNGMRTEREPPFSKRHAMAACAMQWCDELEVPHLPVNIATALFSLGLVALPSGAALPDVSDQDGDRVAIDWQGLAKVLQSERDALQARVAELESQLESVACRAATAETALEAASGGGEQPRGWLTEDEREAVEFLASLDAPPCVDAARKAARIGKELLARSTPPEVVLPENPYHPSGLRQGFDHAIQIVRNELVNAGVAVKEVS